MKLTQFWMERRPCIFCKSYTDTSLAEINAGIEAVCSRCKAVPGIMVLIYLNEGNQNGFQHPDILMQHVGGEDKYHEWWEKNLCHWNVPENKIDICDVPGCEEEVYGDFKTREGGYVSLCVKCFEKSEEF